MTKTQVWKMFSTHRADCDRLGRLLKSPRVSPALKPALSLEWHRLQPELNALRAQYLALP